MIFLPFLPTVNLLRWNVPAKSINTTESPTSGLAGKLIVVSYEVVKIYVTNKQIKEASKVVADG